MKKALIIAVLLALFACGAYVGPLLFAQQQNNAVPPTKVAVINIREVLNQNARAKALKAELEETLKPFKAKGKTLSDEIDALTNSKRFAEAEKKKAEREELSKTLVKLIEDRHKEKLPMVWSEINAGIDAVAKSYGFQIVLGYGDPENPELLAFSVHTSKMRAADMGCTPAVYVHGSVDITNVLIHALASRK